MVLYSYKVIIFEIQFLFQLLFLHRFQRQRLKAHSATCKELAEKPESFGRALIFVGLAEGIAIYGLIIAFIILNR